MIEARAIPQPSDVSGVASAENGLVVLDGPAGIAVTLTPRAAIETARSLMAAATAASADHGSAPGSLS